ncbi:MAG: hypothetical protein ACK5UD_10725, partial [Planctomyces sp.]
MANAGRGGKRGKAADASWGLAEDLKATEAGAAGSSQLPDAAGKSAGGARPAGGGKSGVAGKSDAAGESGAGRLLDPRAVLKTLKQLAQVSDADV